ncbi:MULTISPECIES: LysM peptidoglycan-binding domain-containing protein [Pseudomonas]|nr:MULTISPECIES: LysM domain-containing protein [Pseudomonas]
MDITNHLVRSGETLSGIAHQYGASVGQLRQLNPFIRNANHIQAGWSLSVPAQPGAAIVPTANQPTQGAQESAEVRDSESANERPVLQLEAQTEAQPASAASFDEKAPHPCEPVYANIIYATDEQAFWLLPERVASLMKEAAHKLGQQISPSKSPDERKKGLDESGLLEYFMEPVLANFLAGSQQERMKEIEAEEPYLEARYLDKRSTMVSDPRYQATPVSGYERLKDLYEEWRPLRDSALQIAESRGYAFEQGRLFSPEAMEARKRVQHYLIVRQKLFSLGELQVFSPEQTAELQAENKARLEVATASSAYDRTDYVKYLEWRDSNQQGFKFKEYLDAIHSVAEYGLALPEYALMGSGEEDQLESGIAEFKKYLDLEQQLLAVNQRLQEKYKSWIEASGENASAPAGLVDAERAEWDALQAEKSKLLATAERNVASARAQGRGRHLLWNPEEFTPKPVDRLVKSNFPLREVSFADRGSVLSHFSLTDMRNAFKTDAAKLRSEAAANVRHSISGSNSVATGARSEFEEWLIGQGAKKLDDQRGNWFDPKGWFDVELFYQYLQAESLLVSTLEDSTARAAWGERLQQILFKDSVRVSLRLFDKSPQAQLVRCLTPPQPSIHSAASVATPNFTTANGFQAFASASLDIDLARGEVDLLKVDLPDREQAQDLKLKYFDYEDNEQELNLGRLSLHLSIKAWGYAGASLMVAGTLRIGPDKDTHDVLLDTGQDAERTPGSISSTHVSQPLPAMRTGNMRIDDGLKGQFNLFAGVQVGIKLTGALNWAPPVAVAELRTAPVAGVVGQTAPQPSQWLSLARVGANLSIAAGLGVKGELSVSLQGQRLVLTIKAAVIAGPGVDGVFSFEVGYGAIVQLINIFRRELRKNQYHRLVWFENDAFDFMSKLNLLGSAGLDLALVYMAELVGSLYDALTRGGKGGPIAYSIMNYENQEELKMWFVDAIPEALGPMLMTLVSPPSEFTPEEQADEQSEELCHLLQQQAIEQILRWVVEKANSECTLPAAQRQFEEACTRMNRFGTKPAAAGQAYCENRLALDNFMSVPVLSVGVGGPQNNAMRERYRNHVKVLGKLQDGFCRRSSYYGRTYIPSGHVEYVGPA